MAQVFFSKKDLWGVGEEGLQLSTCIHDKRLARREPDKIRSSFVWGERKLEVGGGAIPQSSVKTIEFMVLGLQSIHY